MDSGLTSERFPGFSRLFWLGGGGDGFVVEPEGIRDPWRILRGEERPLTAIRCRWVLGRGTPRQVVWTNAGIPIMADGLVTILRERKLTGWGTYPVEVYGRKGERIPGYVGLVCLGRCGPRDMRRSVDKLVQYPARLARKRVGLFFDPESWDGSDFSMLEGSGFIIVTVAAKSVIEESGVGRQTVEFTALDEMILEGL